MIAALVAAAGSSVTPEAHAWLVAQIAGAPGTFGPAFAAAGRKLEPRAISEPAAAAITAAGLRWPVTGADECGRAALVLATVAALPGEAQLGFVRDLVRRGALRERQAVLRVLAALPEPARFVELGVDACRSNVETVFAAIACDNDFPARHFPPAAFHQMVLKALFIGAPLARVAGLAARIDGELIRMVDAYVSERRAAGRPIPDDVALIR
ncbi:MAG TPA: EboA domain-containing protein [Kofleriaceae bacterium]|nr:EboA domain-containing protein [Kofleriaceae bacterium]